MAKNHKKDNNAFSCDNNINKNNKIVEEKVALNEASVFDENNIDETEENINKFETSNQTNIESTITGQATTDEICKSNDYKKQNRRSKKKEKKSLKKKTTLSHKLKVLSTLIILGVFTGSGLGVWYFNVNLKSPDYSSFSADAFIKPIGDVLSENFNITSENNYKNWLEYVGNKTPDNISHVDNVLLAIHNATLADSFVFTGNGKVKSMGITQTVYSQRRHVDDIYTFESISKGTISVANLDIYENNRINGNEVKLYTGKKISQQNADWYYNKTISTSDYQNMTGGLPNNITPYIISEKTVSSSTMTKDENGNYIFTFTLDPKTSVLNYYKEVRRTGGLEADPEFKSIKFIATIDDKWNLLTTEVFESYKAVKFAMRITCDGTIKIEYKFNLPEVLLPEIKG